MKALRVTEVLRQVREPVEKHRWTLMKYCLATAILCSLISLGFQQLGNRQIPLILTLLINLILSFALNRMMLKALDGKPYGLREIRELKNQTRTLVLITILEVTVILLGTALVLFWLRWTGLAVMVPAVALLGIVILNCLQHLTLFILAEHPQRVSGALRQAALAVLRGRRMIPSLLMKTVILMLAGSVLVTLVNVFVYAPQIDAALKSAAVVTDQLLVPFFSTSFSYLIQSIGMQLVVSYITIVCGMTCGVYYRRCC